MDLGGRVQFLQAQLFPVCPLTPLTAGGRGFLGSFLSKGLKTNQLEVNTDEKTLRPIARLKEPRDLFALPKDKDNDCSQQAPRWPIECQVIEERITHIPNVPSEPERFYEQLGTELKPNPVGEENGIVVFNYNPISAVNYDKSNSARNLDDDSSDSDVSSCESQGSTPYIKNSKSLGKNTTLFSKILTTLDQRSSSNSNEEDDDDDSGNENDEGVHGGCRRLRGGSKSKAKGECAIAKGEIDDIWADKSPEYMAATPTYIRQKFAKKIYSYTVGEEQDDDRDTSSVNISPIGVNDRLIAGLEVDLSSTSTGNNDQNSYDDSSKDYRSAYAKLKQNPVFNPDMSVNLDELAKLPLRTYSGPSTTATTTVSKRYSQEATRSSPSPDKDTKIPVPLRSASATHLSTTSFIITNSFSLPYSQQTNNSNSNNDAPCSNNSEYDHNYNQNPNINLNLDMNQNHDNHTSSDEFTKTCYLPQFSRSAVGGSKFLTNCHPYNPEEYDGLEFESRFESGNLAKAIQITPTYYELYLRPDLYTSRSRQWYYFRVKRTKRNMLYRFSIVNLIKSDSLYNDGMRPLMYSTHNAKEKNKGWMRCGENICYYRNDDDNQPSDDEEDNSSYTLTFNIEFENDNDTVYFAHSYPYTYSDLQDYLMDIQKHPVKSKFCKLRLLCRTLAGNNVYFLTVTAPAASEEVLKRKKSIVISARVHPSETPASWMMKGLMDFITGESTVAKRLRHKFIFKLIPMLNPDGVIVGNTRNSLTGKDLNRQYRTVIRETYPSIWYTKALIKRLIDECGVSMYCDMHAHSRRHNIFIYGCENKRSTEKKLTEQVFPLMLHKNVADKFSFEDCKFKIQRSKEGTGRIVVWMLGITNSYTIEASFGGSLLGSRKGTHFTTQDYEHMGRAFCETLLDYADENPSKECLRLKIIERLMKEGSSAEEPINIALSDYSSDEGSSSSSENEGKSSSVKGFSDLEGPCCHPLRAPPCSPELDAEARRFRYCRMRKIMQELDRIYFQPLFHKKCQFLFKSDRPIRSKKRKSQKKCEDVTKAKSMKTNTTPCFEAQITPNLIPNSPEEITNNHSQDIPNPAISLRYVVRNSESNESVESVKQENPQECKNAMKRLKGGRTQTDQKPPRKPRLKVSRKLRVWLEKRKILITRRKLSHKIKFRCKSLHRRKKEERLLLDLPTTDPGSELVFSTDDEYVIDLKSIQCYGTMPRYIRRGLLQSELQRRYIEEIGDGFRHMPPELIVTSPSNKIKHPPIKIPIKPIAKKSITPKSAELPAIDEPANRTSTWQHLNTSSQSGSTTTLWPTVNMPKTHSPALSAINISRTPSPLALALNMSRTHSPIPVTKSIFKTKTIAKKEPLSKEDLDIKLSLKKKIWTGIQPDDAAYGVDRTRPLLLAPPASLPTPPPPLKPNKKVTDVKRTNAKRLQNEALLSACTQKLLEWQGTNTNGSRACSPSNQKTKLTADFVIPEVSEERTMRILKHIANIKKPAKPKTNHDGQSKQKRNAVTKVTETSTLITKATKGKTQKTSYRALNKTHNATNAVGSQHKFQGRNGNKFKTGGIVATAVQTSTNGKQKSKKQKSATQKLQDSLGPLKTNGATSGGGGDSRLSTGGGMTVSDGSTTIARKVKTKKKKSPTKLQNISCNLTSNNSTTV